MISRVSSTCFLTVKVNAFKLHTACNIEVEIGVLDVEYGPRVIRAGAVSFKCCLVQIFVLLPIIICCIK